MKYSIASGNLRVEARSKVHDVKTVWSKITGTVDADAEALERATATFDVDMTMFDAGDFIKNRKLRGDFDLEKHPKATFTLQKVRDVVRTGDTFTATAEGVLAWRGKEVLLVLTGRGTLNTTMVEASATFELDIRKLGLSAPRFLMFKMDDVVTVAVTVKGAP